MTSATDPGTLDRFFGISKRGSSVRTEVIAGATTFMTMAYILFVNPVILGKVADAAGHRLPFAAVLTSTALVAAVATVAMGLLANLPLALAAGMGLNSVVAFQLVATMHRKEIAERERAQSTRDHATARDARFVGTHWWDTFRPDRVAGPGQ